MLVCWTCRRNAYRILVEKRLGKRQLRRPRRRFQDSAEIDLKDIRGCGDEEGLAVSQDDAQSQALILTVLR